jgi:formamidopyrimidine-DNA glycosylase
MPELPEVETVRRGLSPVLVDVRIARLTQRRPDLRFPFPERFARRVDGHRVTALRRRAKYLLAELDSGETLVMHLGMTGRFRIEHRDGHRLAPGDFAHASQNDCAHDHVVFEMETGVRVIYNDARRFGFMLLIATTELAQHALFRDLGPEPLGAELTPDYLMRRATGKKADLKAFLLDQRVIAGLGNIYVSEALHRSGLSPKRAADVLAIRRGAANTRVSRLISDIQAVLNDAIEAGGSTLRDFAQADGAPGYFQHAFRVYGRAGEPCLRSECGCEIRRIVQAGRSTFYCPRCQR